MHGQKTNSSTADILKTLNNEAKTLYPNDSSSQFAHMLGNSGSLIGKSDDPFKNLRPDQNVLNVIAFQNQQKMSDYSMSDDSDDEFFYGEQAPSYYA